MNDTTQRSPRAAEAPDPQAGGARERLLEAAEALVYAGGIHATGVDAIVKRSGAARKSFYTHFESKEALVAAALARRDDRWMAWFIDGTLERARTPRARLLAMFDVLHTWFEQPDFHGCAFINAAGEIGDVNDPIRGVARYHKARLLDFAREQCEAFALACGAPQRDAVRLARQWLVLMDGAIAVALVSGDASASRDARDAGEVLLAAFETRAG
ncbi:TetR/AcrR family transcriptional regulator [Burkholderia plantarii]|uniref:Transcriptional regulator, TetR family n=1 Tax=Burkholderia plantarii TaxID=41899 RepID=A0A0B6RRY8_BURPL|nr:TetR/AcrR family transcriptional regulator [Burkholderia plantarii]AJK48112.1 transcriptional regulator, TetR family [Burkholderia plantarii]ALK32298.1 Transcriptional regulator, TetR family [Burkholderia plantarii]WLE61424.1 TetR/AcrR family transcriptional regulator [Burkholderia plantarii]GLZ19247.1 TetR family transcriptional regulator [Burkholderia plantarii]